MEEKRDRMRRCRFTYSFYPLPPSFPLCSSLQANVFGNREFAKGDFVGQGKLQLIYIIYLCISPILIYFNLLYLFNFFYENIFIYLIAVCEIHVGKGKGHNERDYSISTARDLRFATNFKVVLFIFIISLFHIVLEVIFSFLFLLHPITYNQLGRWTAKERM